MKDYFKVLGLKHGADALAVRNAHRKLALRFHPDRVGDSAIELEHFREIQAAYEFLQSEQNRIKHSEQLASFYAEQQPQSLNRVSEWLTINSKAMISRWLNPRAKQELRVLEVPIKVEEALSGCFKTVASERGPVQVYVQAGCYNGQVLYDCFGQDSQPTVAIAKVIPHPRYQIEERGLIMNLPVSVDEARIGARITVATFVGPTSIHLSIKSQSGDEIKLEGRGPLNAHGRRCDLFVRLMIVTDERMIADSRAESVLDQKKAGNA